MSGGLTPLGQVLHGPGERKADMFRDLGIRGKVLTVLALPVLVLAAASGAVWLEAQAQVDRAQQTRAVSVSADHLGRLVVTLQEERLASVQVVTGDTDGRARLAAVRAATDVARVAVTRELATWALQDLLHQRQPRIRQAPVADPLSPTVWLTDDAWVDAPPPAAAEPPAGEAEPRTGEAESGPPAPERVKAGDPCLPWQPEEQPVRAPVAKTESRSVTGGDSADATAVRPRLPRRTPPLPPQPPVRGDGTPDCGRRSPRLLRRRGSFRCRPGRSAPGSASR